MTHLIQQQARKASSKANSNRISSISSQKVQALLDFLRLQARLEGLRGTSGFSHRLGLTAAPTTTPTPTDDGDGSSKRCVQASQFSFIESERPNLSGHPSMVLRYALPPDRFRDVTTKDGDPGDDDDGGGPQSSPRPIRLSTLTSILDEVTTLGMISATLPGRPRPGVSVTMATQWGPAAASLPSCSAVDVVTTLTKGGRNLGFLRAEVRDPGTGGVICFFQHTKYLPVGWLLGTALSPPGLWLLELCSEYLFPLLAASPSSVTTEAQKASTAAAAPAGRGVLDSFQMTGDSTATFEVDTHHTNGFGGLHGGVQSILMERLGRQVARSAFLAALSSSSSPSDGGASSPCSSSPFVSIECDRLHVSYQSSASKHLKLQAFVTEQRRHAHSVTVRVVILRGQRGEGKEELGNPSSSSSKASPATAVVVSEGILTFVRTDQDARIVEASNSARP